MRSLPAPGLAKLERAYRRLLHAKPKAPGVPELALYTQWARFDPRLAEICVGYFSKQWMNINPLALRDEISKQCWPGTIGVLFEFSRRLVESSTVLTNLKLFDHWSSLISTGITKGRGEQFFIGLRQFGGTAMWEDALLSSEEYRRWGYLSRENLIPKSTRLTLSRATRLEILQGLLKTSPRIRTQDYWAAIGESVSWRQAQRDLKSSRLKARGRTKGRYYLRP